jgi:sulfite exporter TauE/SafE
MTELGSSWAALGAALLMGVLGSPHCVGMCGGIATALAPPHDPGARRPRAEGFGLPVILAFGRIGTYAALGMLAGGAGSIVATRFGAAAGPALRFGLGALLVLVGLSVAGWWPQALGWLEGGAGRVWHRLAPVAGRVLPVRTPLRALAAGALWGLLPCGLVYGALAGAAVAGSPAAGAAWMAAFGLGTLPAVLGAGWLAGALRAWAGRRAVRHAAGALLVASGLWTLASPVWMHAMHGAAGTAPHAGHVHAHPGEAPVEAGDGS